MHAGQGFELPADICRTDTCESPVQSKNAELEVTAKAFQPSMGEVPVPIEFFTCRQIGTGKEPE